MYGDYKPLFLILKSEVKQYLKIYLQSDKQCVLMYVNISMFLCNFFYYYLFIYFYLFISL